jgi:hypothetical protein
MEYVIAIAILAGFAYFIFRRVTAAPHVNTGMASKPDNPETDKK